MSILRKLILFNIFIIALSVNGQTTTISSSGVVDSDSITWANGTWSIQFRPSPTNPNVNVYNLGGAPLSAAILYQNGALNGSGTFSATIYDSTRISPGGSGWTIQICPLASAPCGNYIFSSSGMTEDLTAAINSIIPAPRFNALAGAYGYVDVEAHLTIPQGGTYWSNTNNCQRYFNLLTATWVCAAGGSNLIGGTLTPGTIPIATAPQTLGNSLLTFGSGQFDFAANDASMATGTANSSTNAPSFSRSFIGSGWNTGINLSSNCSACTAYANTQVYTATISGETCIVNPTAVAIGTNVGSLNVNLLNPGSGCTVPGTITVTGSPGSGYVGTLTIANDAQIEGWIIEAQYEGPAPDLVDLNIFTPAHRSSSNSYEICSVTQPLQNLASAHCWLADVPINGRFTESYANVTGMQKVTWANSSGVPFVIVGIVAATNCGSLSGSTGCYQVNDGTGTHFVPKF